MGLKHSLETFIGDYLAFISQNTMNNYYKLIRMGLKSKSMNNNCNNQIFFKAVFVFEDKSLINKIIHFSLKKMVDVGSLRKTILFKLSNCLSGRIWMSSLAP